MSYKILFCCIFIMSSNVDEQSLLNASLKLCGRGKRWNNCNNLVALKCTLLKQLKMKFFVSDGKALHLAHFSPLIRSWPSLKHYNLWSKRFYENSEQRFGIREVQIISICNFWPTFFCSSFFILIFQSRYFAQNYLFNSV